MPILILDQFDDYQLAAREHFMGRRRDWIRPSDLIRRNRTWAVIRGLLREGTARLIVVTRSGRQCRAAPKSLHDGSDHLACNAQPHKLRYGSEGIIENAAPSMMANRAHFRLNVSFRRVPLNVSR
jgi:hypothetical protein